MYMHFSTPFPPRAAIERRGGQFINLIFSPSIDFFRRQVRFTLLRGYLVLFDRPATATTTHHFHIDRGKGIEQTQTTKQQKKYIFWIHSHGPQHIFSIIRTQQTFFVIPLNPSLLLTIGTHNRTEHIFSFRKKKKKKKILLFLY